MKKPMRAFKIEGNKVEKHSFIKVRTGLAYAEYGMLKTYSNKTQADKKVKELTALGFNVHFTASHPFLIIPSHDK